MKLSITLKKVTFFVFLSLATFACSKDDDKKDEQKDEQQNNNTSTALFKQGAGVTDAEGNTYKTVIITLSSGTKKSASQQEWMASNLRATKYANGTEIERQKMTPCNNDRSLIDSLGYLYTWDALMNNSTVAGSQGACPNGWHVPTIDEYKTLVNGLGGNAIAGKKMKSVNSTYWNDITKATNESGFNAQGGGWVMNGMSFWNKSNAMFWSSSNTEVIQLKDKEEGVVFTSSSSSTMVSCRCIKD